MDWPFTLPWVIMAAPALPAPLKYQKILHLLTPLNYLLTYQNWKQSACQGPEGFNRPYWPWPPHRTLWSPYQWHHFPQKVPISALSRAVGTCPSDTVGCWSPAPQSCPAWPWALLSGVHLWANILTWLGPSPGSWLMPNAAPQFTWLGQGDRSWLARSCPAAAGHPHAPGAWSSQPLCPADTVFITDNGSQIGHSILKMLI